MAEDNIFDAFGSAMSDLGGKSVLPSNYGTSTPFPSLPAVSSQSSSGRMSSGMTTDETSMVGAGVGGLLEGGSNVLLGYLESKDKEKYRKEDRALSEINRKDTLEKRRKENLLKQKTIEQEEQAFKTNKFIESQNMRHNLFVQKFKEATESRQRLITGFSKLKQDANKNAEIRNILINSFRRK